MTTISIAVVAHQDRRAMADALAEQIDADAIFIDDGTIGAQANHRAAWAWHANNAATAPIRPTELPIFRGWSDRPFRDTDKRPTTDHATLLTDAPTSTLEWAVAVEDDAMPVDGFRDQLAGALAVAPAPIVSLYLGTGRPTHWQPIIRRALDTDDPPHWLTSDHLLHAVAVAIRADLLPMQLDDRPTDEAITHWARRKRHQIAYSVPSLCDHADIEPIITTRADHTPRDQPRRAHFVGTRLTWTDRTATLT